MSRGSVFETLAGALLWSGFLFGWAVLPAQAVTIDWVSVGNPGNPADTTVMSDGASGYGSVPYAYRIGKYDVTNSQYAEFLNARDPSGTNRLGLYNTNMSDAMFGGISFTVGAANGSKYNVVAGRGNYPVNYVSWYSAIRFANWLNNGQGSGDTEKGAYLLQGGTPTPSNANSIARQPGATVFLPNENEWYKAAYYNPGTNSYYRYPTSSNTKPTASGPTEAPNHANFSGGPQELTAVGAYPGTTSPCGAFDMGGNVRQWNEALIRETHRGLRGCSFWINSSFLLCSHRGQKVEPTDENPDIGFRVASVP